LYACQELGCDDAATMRVSAYKGGVFIGSATRTASAPGTWPSDTLACTFPEGFDSVVVHYDSRPPTCQDYGVIFMADDMRVTPLAGTGVLDPGEERPCVFELRQNYPNPFNPVTRIAYVLPSPGEVTFEVFNLLGEQVASQRLAMESAGEHLLLFDATDLPGGVYLYRLVVGNAVETKRMILMR
jgi:hypothetical protein